MVATVKTLRSSVVKGLAQASVPELALEPAGISRDRRFGLLADTGLLLYSGELRSLAGATGEWDEDAETLTVHFADGASVTTSAIGTEPVPVRLEYDYEPVTATLLNGDLAAAVSERFGQPVQVVRLPVSGGNDGPVTVITTASLARLQGQMGLERLDPRRFKMTIELDGPGAHEEDAWEGRELVVGDVRLRVGGGVPRCMLTTLDPDTLERDADTLRALLAYRAPMPGGAPPFGVYAEVVTPGFVRVGDSAAVS